MTAKEWWEFTHTSGQKPEDGKYSKPEGIPTPGQLVAMVGAGFDALDDAFKVVKERHLFNILNSSTNTVEEFKPAEAKYYSQAQCAIALERVFNGIYEYLQFKTHTGCTYPRHVNVDNGYKYLDTESLLGSDHEVGVYYDPSDRGKDYLRYLHVLDKYANDSGFGFTDYERAILTEFCQVLKYTTFDWISETWDPCPLRPRGITPELVSNVMSTSSAKSRAVGTTGPVTLILDFNHMSSMTWNGSAQENI